ncbi:hypothetical protein IFM89_031054 [Coptis chinensis]|uniref:Uncharacterized protein n=1 Tax=Coptis chinensis TaxID=261450 RepID=A0A835HA18_9MAGN|nr:hypothetical protein IFM89_031054 [Coptis chinensis]
MATQMVLLNPVLTLISALVIPCISLVIAHLGETLRQISNEAHLTVAKLSEYLNEVLPSMLFVKASNAELCECSRFQRLAHADLSKNLRKKRMKALIPQIVQAIYVGVLLLLCFGSLVLLRSFFDGSRMVSFLTSLFLLVEPIQVIEKSDAVELDAVKGDVKFCDISFKYSDTSPLVLNKLNLHVKPGETIAFIGPSGGGKTTLTKLLLRLYDPLCGSILLDNCDIHKIQLKSLRRHVGLVSQDITLFSGSVAENIGYRDLMSKIDMDWVEHAARTANADGFIRKLSDGYETNIGPRGSILSGGQKQRLAIARAIYQNSSVLIMDEATSALDSKSEKLVRQAVERLMENHTVLVIAHRLETILMADRIFLLENGDLEEITQTSLLTKSGQYSSQISNEPVI